MRLRDWLLLALLLGGCSFDPKGLAVGGADAPPADGSPAVDGPGSETALDGTPTNEALLCGDTLRSLDGPAAVDLGPVDLGPADVGIPDMPPPPLDACATGQLLCGGSGCTTQSVDNCGGCGTVCDPHLADHCAGATTGRGTCACGSNPACSAGQRCCGGSCVDLTLSGNCGGCGIACGTGQSCTNYLAAGVYVCTCGSAADCTPMAPYCGGTSHICECGTGSHSACDSVTSSGCSNAGAAGTCSCGAGAACTYPTQTCGSGSACAAW